MRAQRSVRTAHRGLPGWPQEGGHKGRSEAVVDLVLSRDDLSHVANLSILCAERRYGPHPADAARLPGSHAVRDLRGASSGFGACLGALRRGHNASPPAVRGS